VTEPTLNRRDFLRRGLQLSAVAFGALGAESPPLGTSGASAERFLGAPQWCRLQASLTGSLVLPSGTSFGQDRLLYNSRFYDLVPQAIAYCENAQDVARCLSFARANELPFAARSGGHSYGGYSSSSGLIIDVSAMKEISVSSRSGLASIGAGAQLIDVYNTLGQHQRLLPAGSCPTVGIAGLTLGGAWEFSLASSV
jgi:FAD/FMN-containing dehydrogenase